MNWVEIQARKQFLTENGEFSTRKQIRIKQTKIIHTAQTPCPAFPNIGIVG